MTRPWRISGALLCANLCLTGCGYFNTMYNAKRAFADAEKAAARGDRAAAETAYRRSIEKAGKNVSRHPGGRWRDDARLLIARAYIALGDYAAARQVLHELLAVESDSEAKGVADLYLGLIEANTGSDSVALGHLDRALVQGRSARSLRGIGRLERARIHFRQRNYELARQDLAAIHPDEPSDLRLNALLLDFRIAVATRDSASAQQSLAELFPELKEAAWADSVKRAGNEAATTFGHQNLRTFFEPAARSPLLPAVRDSLLLYRAGLAVLAGDTATAIAEALAIAGRATGAVGDLARVQAAEWQLAQTTSVEQLHLVRAGLLAAVGSPRGRALIHSIKTLEVMLEKASQTGQPLQLFAAAELARDELGAPRLASRLFLTYAEVAPQTVWAGKALLAALALEPADGGAHIHKRLESLSENPYVSAVRGEVDADAFSLAEERLSRGLQAIRAEAQAEAVRRENVVGRASALIDSIRVAAQTDSTRIRCGILIDSLAVAGIRADSIRAACHRNDTTRITLLLKADTLLLRDPNKAKADSIARRARRDTTETTRHLKPVSHRVTEYHGVHEEQIFCCFSFGVSERPRLTQCNGLCLDLSRFRGQ